MIFPENAITYTTVMIGVADETIELAVNGYDVHIYSVTMQQENVASDTIIFCGTEQIAKNYGKDFPQMFTSKKCDSTRFYIDKTGNDEAFISVTYSTSSPVFYQTVTGVDTINGFTFGEMIIGTFLFFMLTIMFFGGVWNRITGIKTKIGSHNNYMGNNSQEGKIMYHD